MYIYLLFTFKKTIKKISVFSCIYLLSIKIILIFFFFLKIILYFLNDYRITIENKIYFNFENHAFVSRIQNTDCHSELKKITTSLNIT